LRLRLLLRLRLTVFLDVFDLRLRLRLTVFLDVFDLRLRLRPPIKVSSNPII
jgi:hypothetical protein